MLDGNNAVGLATSLPHVGLRLLRLRRWLLAEGLMHRIDLDDWHSLPTQTRDLPRFFRQD